MKIEFTIPGEPCAKGRPRMGRSKSGFAVAYTPEKTRTREGVIASIAMDAMKGREPFTGPVSVSILAYLGIPKSWPKKRIADPDTWGRPTKKPDADNLLKLVTDALNGIGYKDDSQIVTVLCAKFWASNPRTDIWIEEVQDGLE
jgi:Holliday junction resolvase RusA-like endonuclease